MKKRSSREKQALKEAKKEKKKVVHRNGSRIFQKNSMPDAQKGMSVSEIQSFATNLSYEEIKALNKKQTNPRFFFL